MNINRIICYIKYILLEFWKLMLSRIGEKKKLWLLWENIIIINYYKVVFDKKININLSN